MNLISSNLTRIDCPNDIIVTTGRDNAWTSTSRAEICSAQWTAQSYILTAFKWSVSRCWTDGGICDFQTKGRVCRSTWTTFAVILNLLLCGRLRYNVDSFLLNEVHVYTRKELGNLTLEEVVGRFSLMVEQVANMARMWRVFPWH